jgi:hypothetical protein
MLASPQDESVALYVVRGSGCLGHATIMSGHSARAEQLAMAVLPAILGTLTWQGNIQHAL